MIHFFNHHDHYYYAVETKENLSPEVVDKFNWLFGESKKIDSSSVELEDKIFLGPRAAMISPWSTNAVEIAQNMGITDVLRIEEYKIIDAEFSDFDPMLMEK